MYNHLLGYIHSIDPVREELLRDHVDDHLVKWVGKAVPNEFFLNCNDENVVNAFRQVMLWVTRHAQYYDEAKAKFASGADGWLIAHGMVSRKTIVTNEQPSPESRNQIKLPDVCDAFSVDFEDTFTMLHKLDVQYRFFKKL